MADYTDADLEYMARLVARYPDNWRHWMREAQRMAKRMAATGVKMTTRNSIGTPGASDGWNLAPMTPGTDQPATDARLGEE